MTYNYQENQCLGVPDDDDDNADNEFSYLILTPENGGLWDLFKYTIFAEIGSGVRFLESSDQEVMNRVADEHRWGMIAVIIIRKLITVFGRPMEFTGHLIDFLLNLLSLNGNLFGLLYNLVHGKVVVPQKDTETFISIFGHSDGRIDLWKGENLAEDIVASVSEETSMKSELGNPALMDLCVMASKLAYENAKVIRNIVVDHWKMHFIDFCSCWNDFQKEMSTNLFILCDKPGDANLILISFRGREPFHANVWSNEFDYSWYEIPNFGKVHMGFLEALGLGNRTNVATFHNHLQSCNSEEPATTSRSKKVSPEMMEISAYYAVRRKLKSSLEEHKNAKFVVTGHSLGGALAILFTTVLILHEEMKVMQRFLGVYTFGQPRVGDMQLARCMEARLDSPVPKYFRVVYSNDLLPWLPYDHKNFMFKHFGVCLQYDSLYNEQRLEDEPNNNYFGLRYLIPKYLNSVSELIRSITMGYRYGPEYEEGWFSLLVRMTGVVFPGTSAHCVTDYINSVKLGKGRKIGMSYF